MVMLNSKQEVDSDTFRVMKEGRVYAVRTHKFLLKVFHHKLHQNFKHNEDWYKIVKIYPNETSTGFRAGCSRCGHGNEQYKESIRPIRAVRITSDDHIDLEGAYLLRIA